MASLQGVLVERETAVQVPDGIVGYYADCKMKNGY